MGAGHPFSSGNGEYVAFLPYPKVRERIGLWIERLQGQRVDTLQSDCRNPTLCDWEWRSYAISQEDSMFRLHSGQIFVQFMHLSELGAGCRHREVHLGTEKGGGSDHNNQGDHPLSSAEYRGELPCIFWVLPWTLTSHTNADQSFQIPPSTHL